MRYPVCAGRCTSLDATTLAHHSSRDLLGFILVGSAFEHAVFDVLVLAFQAFGIWRLLTLVIKS